MVKIINYNTILLIHVVLVRLPMADAEHRYPLSTVLNQNDLLLEIHFRVVGELFPFFLYLGMQGVRWVVRYRLTNILTFTVEM